MKVAELYAQLGVKVDPSDLGTLKEFEKILNGIAVAARSAATALRRFSRVTMSGMTTRTAPAAAAGAPVAAGAVPPQTLLSTVIAQAGAVNQQASAQAGTANVAGQHPNNPFATALGKSLGSVLLKALGIATLGMAVKTLASALKEMTQASMAAVFGVDKFTTQTGLSREELKRWEYVAALSDVTTEELQDTLKGLQQTTRRIQFTGEGATPFLQLGINAMSSPTEIMRQFAQRTRAMDTGTAVYFGRLTGISENMVYMLRKNVDNLDKLLPDRMLTDTQQRAMMDLNTEWAKLTFNIGLLRDKFVVGLAPALTRILELMDRLLDWQMSAKDPSAAGRVFMSPMGMAFPGLLGSMNGGSTTNINNDIKIENRGTGNSPADGRAMGQAFIKETSKAYFQRTPSFIGAGF